MMLYIIYVVNLNKSVKLIRLYSLNSPLDKKYMSKNKLSIKSILNKYWVQGYLLRARAINP
jgi:hypothetical protein